MARSLAKARGLHYFSTMPPLRVLCIAVCALISGPALAQDLIAPFAKYLEAHRDGVAPNSVNFAALDGDRSRLPIGVFDSGIGGLTVLEAILKLDSFNNQTLQPGPDGVPDFEGEQFIYLGDQANMPYGNYPAQGAEPYLKELILKDAVFLLGSRHRASAGAPARSDKLPVKAIVIACNTATAYGLEEIRGLLAKLNLDVPVIGVIEAGARAVAAELPEDGRARSVAVLATVGTCASNAYPKAIGSAVGRSGKRVPPVVQQGSVGLAGAIEGSPAFLARADDSAPYEGPKLDPALLPMYGFDPAGLRGDPARPTTLRLASVPNYARYDVTTLLQKSPPPAGAPIELVVLGCTHFPMAKSALADAFTHARSYRDSAGAQPFAGAVSPELRFIDPAEATAKELFREFARHRLRNKSGAAGRATSFYLSVPNPGAPGVQLTPNGALTPDYKVSRQPGRLDLEDTVAVPVNSDSLPPTARTLVQSLPEVWQRISVRAGSDSLAELPRIGGFVVAGHAWTWGKGTLFEAIEHTQAAGANALEVFLMGMKISAETGDVVLDETLSDEMIARVQEKARRHGVRIINAYIGQKQWTRIGQDEAALRKFFEFGRKLGLAGFTGEPALAQWDMVERLVKEFDVTFAIHNHARGFEAEYFGGPYPYVDPREPAAKLNAQNRDARFGICLDTGHVARSGLDVLAVLKGIAGRCISLHLKDISAPTPEAHDVPYGKGIVAIRAVLAELRRQNIRGHVGLEYEWTESPTFATDVKGLVEFIRAAE